MFGFRWWVKARLIEILMEIRLMRASTQHLSDAVSALALSVSNGNAEIKSELDAILAAKDDDDTTAVEASVAKIKDLTGSIDAAVKAAQDALANPPAQTDPNAPPAQQ